MLARILEPCLVALGLLHFKLFSNKFCYQDVKAIESYKFRALRRLLIRSYEEIEFYRIRFDESGFHPKRDFLSLSDMSKVPILTKRDARENASLIVNKKRSQWGLNFKTSGSTGHPFSVLVSPLHWIIEQSVVWRHWSWAGYKFRDRMAIVRSYVPDDERELIKWDRLRNFIYFSPFHLSDANIAMYVREMKQRKVKFLRGYPSSVKAIALFLRANHHVSPPKLKAILTASERLSTEDRVLIEEALGAKVYNHYGLAEQIVMLGTCEIGSHMHNYEEYGHLEISSDGQIIGTNLHNFAMPLIRYETGDRAILTESPCSCGRTQFAPFILNVDGRLDSFISLADGTTVPLTNFYTMFEHFGEHIKRWQLVQCSVDKLEVRLELARDVLDPKVEARIKSELFKRLEDRIDISILTTLPLLQVGEGKLNPFIKRF